MTRLPSGAISFDEIQRRMRACLRVARRDVVRVAGQYEELRVRDRLLPRTRRVDKNGKDLLAALKSDASSISTAISTSLGNHNHIALGLVARAAGGDPRKLRIAVFNSGGDSLTAELGGHVDLVVIPAATALPHMQAGRIRFIAVTSPRRLEGSMADVPTWRDLGANAVVSNWRVMLGSKGMTPPQVAYWENVFGRVVQSEEWRSMLERDVVTGEFRRSAETRDFIRAQYEELKGVLGELGLVKQ